MIISSLLVTDDNHDTWVSLLGYYGHERELAMWSYTRGDMVPHYPVPTIYNNEDNQHWFVCYVANLINHRR